MNLLNNTFANIAEAIRNVTFSNSLCSPLNMPAVINNVISETRYTTIYNDDRDNQEYVATLKADGSNKTVINNIIQSSILFNNQKISVESYTPVTQRESTKYITNQVYEVTDANNLFTNISALPDPVIVVGSKVTNIDRLFFNSRALVANLDTNIVISDKNINSLYRVFDNCYNLTGNPICGNNITNMYSTYKNCYNITNSPVCGPNVIDMCQTYQNCYNLTGNPACGPNVTNMSQTYYYCTRLTGLPICGNNVINMYQTYQNCYNLTGNPACGPNVTNM